MNNYATTNEIHNGYQAWVRETYNEISPLMACMAFGLSNTIEDSEDVDSIEVDLIEMDGTLEDMIESLEGLYNDDDIIF